MCDAATLVTLNACSVFHYRRDRKAPSRGGETSKKAGVGASRKARLSRRMTNDAFASLDVSERTGPKPERFSPASSSSCSSRDSPTGTVRHRNSSGQSAGGAPPPEGCPGVPGDACASLAKSADLLAGRKCSEYIRNLAAKYNGGSRFSLKSTRHPVAVAEGGEKDWVGTASAGPFEAHLPGVYASTLIPGPLPFPGLGGGYPMMDMSSTQALLSMTGTKPTSKRFLESGTATPDVLDLTSPAVKAARGDRSPRSARFPHGQGASGQNQQHHFHPHQQQQLEDQFRPGRGTTPFLGEVPCDVISRCPSGRELEEWTVDDVCRFVSSMEVCAEYAQIFRDHHIDGSILPLLTEDHLVGKLQMKLGPALKLLSSLGGGGGTVRPGACAKCSHCMHCHARDAKVPWVRDQ